MKRNGLFSQSLLFIPHPFSPASFLNSRFITHRYPGLSTKPSLTDRLLPPFAPLAYTNWYRGSMLIGVLFEIRLNRGLAQALP